MSELGKYTEAELLEELARRFNSREVKEPVQWCEDCINYRYWAKEGDPPDSYNPCAKKHKLSFRTPEDIGDEYGYYRRVCKDRSAKK